MVKKNLGDDLAQAMDNVLNDEEYQKIFTRPKLASKTVVEEDRPLDSVQDAFDALLEVSAELDELGLSRSAGLALKAAHSIVSEAHDEDDPLGSVMKNWKPLHQDDSRKNPTLFLMPEGMEVEEPAKMEEDEDLKGLLEELGDENEVMDVPSDKDEKEGNPESC